MAKQSESNAELMRKKQMEGQCALRKHAPFPAYHSGRNNMDANKSLTANSRREKKEKRRRRAKGEGRSENKKIKTRPGRGDSAMDTTMRQFLPATANNSYGETWRDLQIIQYGAIFGAFHAKNGEQGRGGCF